MPIIQVNLIEGRSAAQKEKLIEALTDGAVQALGAPRESVRVLIYELPGAHWGVAGKAKCNATGGDKK
jgi:4-oxalocrotonate tautomerase